MFICFIINYPNNPEWTPKFFKQSFRKKKISKFVFLFLFKDSLNVSYCYFYLQLSFKLMAEYNFPLTIFFYKLKIFEKKNIIMSIIYNILV